MEVNIRKLALFLGVGLLIVLLGLGSLGYVVISNLGGQNKGKENIAVINVSGPITGGGGGNFLDGARTGSRKLMTQINRAKDDKTVKAILLRVNSPGGSAAASDEIYRELKKFKATEKPVVVSMGDMAASGGYYISAIGDKIFANPSTITGSIGVIMQFQNLQELYNKLGIEPKTFKSGPHKDMGNPDRKLTAEEKEILQNMIDRVYQQFVTAVSEGRNMSKSKVEEVADGRIFTGKRAKELGLVDKLGTFYDAVDTTAKLAGIEGEPNLLYYNQASPIERLLSSVTRGINHILLGQKLGQELKLNNLNTDINESEILYYRFLQNRNVNYLEGLQLQY